ncbi:uncharacterized protein si:ch211-67e16.3 [Alosa sapidissima]|uniref:uncharacterized protein si:ch211-67e16.3 n=1 Tax=Alosa sapidissima TaxID=34773 RepID=UPI001C081DA5|nr:uncharacterized protein si:ch211-67e16.3 [Alosa sapidissima]
MREASLCLVLVLCSAPGYNSEFTVSEPYMHTLHRNGSVSVTCHHNNSAAKEMDAKLLCGGGIMCEEKKHGCSMWSVSQLNVTFNLWNLQAGDEEQLCWCMFSRTDPLPVIQVEGSKTKLFPGSKIPFPPPRNTTCAPLSTSAPDPSDSTPPTDPLVWVLAGAVALLCLYSFVVTILFLKLKVSRKEVLYDTLTYIPVQGRAVRGPRDVNEEYMDMREVQTKTWPTRDLNHNSQATPPNGFHV